MLPNHTRKALLDELEYLIETNGNRVRMNEIRRILQKHSGKRKNEHGPNGFNSTDSINRVDVALNK